MGQINIESKKSWLMWLMAVAFFAFQFVLRLYPGLVMPEIMGKFQVDATSFGVLSAAYYLGYAGMQIPVGILLDRYNPRLVISGAALTCAIGTLSFVYADHWNLTLFGRFLVGVGSAAGFLGTAKTIRIAFPEKKFTTLMGLTFTLGLSGALYGGKPVSLLIQQFGWIPVLKILALISFVIAACIFIFFPRTTTQTQAAVQPSNSELMGSLKLILGNNKIIWLGVAGALLVGPLESFADVWGVSYLVNVYGIAKPEASLITSCIYLGMLLGGPLLSYIAEKTQAHYLINSICGLFMAAIFILVMTTNIASSQPLLMGLMTTVGVLCCYQAVVFAIACRLAPPHLSGLATSVTNCINMFGGCVLHFAMGWVMDQRWQGELENGIKVYDSTSYTLAIAVIPATLVLGFIVFLVLKRGDETPPQNLVKNS